MEDCAAPNPARPKANRHSRSCSLRRNCSIESSGTSIDAPGWGHAEAYLALGRELQTRGDHLGARNWIEKSLIAAPDLQGRATPDGNSVGEAMIPSSPVRRAANLVSFGAMKPQGTQLSLFETRSSSDPFAVRVSPRARRLTARVHVGGRVEIVVPVGVNAHAVRDFVQRFTPWIDRKVAAMRCFVAPSEPVPPAHRIRLHRRDAWRSNGAAARRPGSQQHGDRIIVQAPDDAAARGSAAGLAEGARPKSGWRRGCWSWRRT